MAAQPFVRPANDLDRRALGKYELLCRLSTGGMSEIFLAFQKGLAGFKKIVVLKSILPDIGGEEEFVRMFLEEARTTAAFNHPHIAQVFDLDVDADQLFIAMEFVQGCTLVEMARACRTAKEPIPVGFTLQAVRDTALALHYAHTFTDPRGRRQIVIHRDVAEKNIMVTYEGTTKLLDFGIAKALGRRQMTSVGMVKGTSGYMSPEQIRGEPLDPRSDVFSLGVVLHECLTGMRLFHGKSAEEGMMAALKEEVQPPSRLNPEVTPALDELTLKALAREREHRFPSALEMARELEKACPGLIWLPEQSGALVARHFADRRMQTRTILEQAQGPEKTGELVLEDLLKAGREHKTSPARPSLVPPPISPPRPLVSPPQRRDAKPMAKPAKETTTTTTDAGGPAFSKDQTSPLNLTLETDDDEPGMKTVPAAALPELRGFLEGNKPTGELPIIRGSDATGSNDESTGQGQSLLRRTASADTIPSDLQPSMSGFEDLDSDGGVKTTVATPFEEHSRTETNADDDGPLGREPATTGTMGRAATANLRWFGIGVGLALLLIIGLLAVLKRGPFADPVPPESPPTLPKKMGETPPKDGAPKPVELKALELKPELPKPADKVEPKPETKAPEPVKPPEPIAAAPEPVPEPPKPEVKPEPKAITFQPKGKSPSAEQVAKGFPVRRPEPRPQPKSLKVAAGPSANVQLVMKPSVKVSFKGQVLGTTPLSTSLPLGRQTVLVTPVEGGDARPWSFEVKESGGSIRGDYEDLQ